jgi:hypothetical protein
MAKKIKTYNVYGIVTGSKYLGQVEAFSKDEAEEKAWSELEASVSLCHQCSREASDAEIYKVEVEEVK